MRIPGIELPPQLASAFDACREHVRLAIILSALVNILYLAPTIYMMQVYDRVVTTRGETTLYWLTLVVGIALLTLALLDQVRNRVLLRAGLRLEKILAPQLLEAALAGGPLASRPRSLREFDQVRSALAGPTMIALSDIPWTPIYILVAMLVHPLLGLSILLGAALLVGVAILNERATRAAARQAQQVLAASYAEQERMQAASETIGALGMRRALVARLAGNRTRGLSMVNEHQFTGSRYTSLAKFLRLFLQSLALGIGALLAIEGKISIGAIIAASVLMGRALQPMEALVGQWKTLLDARSALAQLAEDFAARPPAPEKRFALPAPQGRVRAATVGVRRPGEGPPLLQGISFDVAAGGFVGIVGPSGAGKSTLIRVLAGALVPDAGEVRYDDSDLRDWDSDKLAAFVGYLPQDPLLLPGSIAENISRFAVEGGSDQTTTDAAVLEAAEAAAVHSMIASLPGGYDARIGWNGAGLSAGQRQRVALARALFGAPPVLLFDEPDTGLDSDGEIALRSALVAARKRGATIFLATHRPSLLADAVQIMVLNQGRMQMFGPAAEVRAKLAQQRPQAPGPRLSEVSAS